MKTIDLIEKLKEKKIIRIQDIERITDCDRKYAKLILNRLKKRNLIKKVGENSYTTKDNIFVIASNIVYPSYVSFWSASYFLGYTEQIVNTMQIASTKRKKQLKFQDYKIKFIPLKYFFGYKKINTKDGEIFIAEDEKLLIDSFLNYKELGNFDEIKKIFENSIIFKEKIIEYLKRINNQTMIKRVGFLLDNIKKIDILKSFKLDKNYPALNPFNRKCNKIDKKWRLKI